MTSFILFLVILCVLVLSHEFGHFIVAKWVGIKVEEFGFGFPPRLYAKKRGETIYSLNWIPFGGFVRLLGEDPEELVAPEEMHRSFAQKSVRARAAVIVAGVTFNLILAWLIITLGFLTGLPMPAGAAPTGAVIGESRLVITDVRKDSPAFMVGMKKADIILAVRDESSDAVLQTLSPEGLVAFVEKRGGNNLALDLSRGGEKITIRVIPAIGIVPDRAAVGIGLDAVARVRLSPPRALFEAGKLTISITTSTLRALFGLIADLGRGAISREAVTGPIGIIGLVSTARSFGFIFLLGLTAIISINLAVINLLPIPALDGGHLLFLIIETFRGRPVSKNIRSRASGVCFTLLLALMVLVTVFDVLKLFQ